MKQENLLNEQQVKIKYEEPVLTRLKDAIPDWSIGEGAGPLGNCTPSSGVSFICYSNF